MRLLMWKKFSVTAQLVIAKLCLRLADKKNKRGINIWVKNVD